MKKEKVKTEQSTQRIASFHFNSHIIEFHSQTH